MIIDVLKMKQEGKLDGEFTFEYTPSNDLIISLPDASFASPIKVSAYIEIEGKDVYADVKIAYVITCPCSRCLESASVETIYEYSAKYSLFEEEDCYIYKSGKVDLTSSVQEAIIVSQPSAVYCKEDCKGLCPTCGANLNKEDCGHGNN